MGSGKPEADAEILTITNDLLQRLGLKNYFLKIGHMGIIRGILSQEGIAEVQQNQVMQLLDHKRWEEALTLTQKLGVSQKCLATLKNIFEIRGRDAAQVLKKAKESVQNYDKAVTAIENLQEILDLAWKSGFKFETLIDAGFARGLEYYTGMIVEPNIPELEGIALGGGGRYDKLIELFGGEPTPAVGIALGPDRIILAMKKQKVSWKAGVEKRVLVIPMSQEMREKALEVSSRLRVAGISSETEVMGRGVSKALSDADRRGFAYAVLIGPEEAKMDKAVLRDMKKREQKTVEIKNLVKEIMVKRR
jgi:histidyl-tRNA synthetase